MTKWKAHALRIIGHIKISLGKLVRSERLLASGASQVYRGEEQVAEAIAQSGRWLRRRSK